MKRKVYLEDIPLEEARRRWWAALEAAGAVEPLGGETVALAAALGRVTAEPVWAKLSSPHYHGSAMDGAAVRAEDTVGASETNPVRLKLGSQATWVDTGDPLPPGANAVVMIEHIQTVGDDEIELMAPVAPWHHVRAMGEDIVATELVLPGGKTLTPVDLGAIAACGLTEVRVRRRPKVAVLPTGSEQIVHCAQPHFRLVSSTSGRLDYIETIRQWRQRFAERTVSKTLLKLRLVPRWLTSSDFRLAFTSGVSANSVCFERELLDHYRLVFEREG